MVVFFSDQADQTVSGTSCIHFARISVSRPPSTIAPGSICCSCRLLRTLCKCIWAFHSSARLLRQGGRIVLSDTRFRAWEGDSKKRLPWSPSGSWGRTKKTSIGGTERKFDHDVRIWHLNIIWSSNDSINSLNNPDKGAITHAIVHRALWEYLSAVSDTEDESEREKLRREIFERWIQAQLRYYPVMKYLQLSGCPCRDGPYQGRQQGCERFHCSRDGEGAKLFIGSCSES